MNNQTYILYHHDSPICQDALKSLPPDYETNLKLHNVSHDTHDLMHPHVAQTVINKREFKAENPNRTLTPTVMYYDHKTASYIKREGVEAIKFIHNYSTQKKSMTLTQMHQEHTGKVTKIEETGSNLKKILNMHVERTAFKTEQQSQPESTQNTFRHIVESNHKLQLQKLYNRLHNEVHRKAPEHGRK